VPYDEAMPKQKKENNKKHELTLDDLARMVQNGFEQTASKDDLKEVNERIAGLDARITGLDQKMDAQYQDIIHELKPLTKLVPNLEADIIEHARRLDRIEKKIGIGKE
jgi:predicted component of type VI protein secretion system